jgi:hypothetical protein
MALSSATRAAFRALLDEVKIKIMEVQEPIRRLNAAKDIIKNTIDQYEEIYPPQLIPFEEFANQHFTAEVTSAVQAVLNFINNGAEDGSIIGMDHLYEILNTWYEEAEIEAPMPLLGGRRRRNTRRRHGGGRRKATRRRGDRLHRKATRRHGRRKASRRH